MASRQTLKRDALGAIYTDVSGSTTVLVRDLGLAMPGCRWIARRLARREAAALAALEDLPGTPKLIRLDSRELVRSYLPGSPMYVGRPVSRAYFRNALRLVRRMHRAGVAHNDLAKEANWICLAANECGVVDFQLASLTRRRGRLFRLMAREDLRHLLKHKRFYLPGALTARERAILDSPSFVSRLWRAFVKPPYLFVTRRLLRWPERTGPRERGTLE